MRGAMFNHCLNFIALAPGSASAAAIQHLAEPFARLALSACYSKQGTLRRKRAWRGHNKSLKLPAWNKGPHRSQRRLPMELTGTVTAILALVSFGFVAAIILGMI
jgi:hypothetical protein